MLLNTNLINKIKWETKIFPFSEVNSMMLGHPSKNHRMSPTIIFVILVYLISCLEQLIWEKYINVHLFWIIKAEIHLCYFSQKHALMQQVAHQTIVMQFILELSKSLKVDPRACFRQFFAKIKVSFTQVRESILS